MRSSTSPSPPEGTSMTFRSDRIAALALVSLAAACHGAKKSEEESSRAVTCARVEKADAFEVRTLRGPLRPPPDRDAPVAARSSGVLIAISAREGDTVKRGAVLAQLD